MSEIKEFSLERWQQANIDALKHLEKEIDKIKTRLDVLEQQSGE